MYQGAADSKDEVEFSMQRCREGQRRASQRGCAKVYGGPNGKADSLELQRGQVSSQRANTNWMVWGVVLDTCAERHGKASTLKNAEV